MTTSAGAPQVLSLNATMVHEIPRGRGRASNQTEEAVLSESLTGLDLRTDRFIREQMLLPTLPTARQIVATGTEDETTTPRLAHAILDDDLNLPENSRLLASHLFNVQSGLASSGIFMISKATLNGRAVIVLLKAEHQEGVRLRQSGSGGHVAFEVEHISELIVGQNSRVYKIAVLWFDAEAGRIEGLMVDKQNGASFADYFLDGFLEMSLRHRSEVTTKEFMETAKEHINSASWDGQKKLRYTDALVAVLQSPASTIDVPNFIKTFIDPDDRDDFSAAMPEHTKAPFRKDLKLVQSKIGGMQLRFRGSAVELRASHEAVENGLVDVREAEVVVRASPDSIEPSGPPR